MTEIVDIVQIIDSGVYSIDNLIRHYQWQIDNQGKFYEWEKPNIENAKNNISQLLKQRESETNLIIENTKTVVDELSSKYGVNYFVVYSKDEKHIGVHRERCENYNRWIKKHEPSIKNGRTYEDVVKISFTLVQEINTDITSDCEECKPFWNLPSIKKSLPLNT
jgi:hypothetical protein